MTVHLKTVASEVNTAGAATSAKLEFISQEQLISGLSRTPIEDHVIWTGVHYEGREASFRARVLSLVTEPWAPVAVRVLVTAAARLAGEYGVSPDRVRAAIRMHQGARGAAYILVRRTPAADFIAATAVPTPSVGRPLVEGDLVLSSGDARSTAGRRLFAQFVRGEHGGGVGE